MPISLTLPIRKSPSAQIVNPALPLVQIQGMSSEKGEYYYGFDSRLDLSYRGGLDDTIMMYVQSPAQVFGAVTLLIFTMGAHGLNRMPVK